MEKTRVLVVDDDAVLSFCCLLCSPWRFLSLPSGGTEGFYCGLPATTLWVRKRKRLGIVLFHPGQYHRSIKLVYDTPH